jgi:autotransporter-associated beta strand protein
MNTPIRIPSRLAATLALCAFSLPFAHAADYTWLTTAGTWDTSAANWNDGVTNPTTWSNGNNALFTGTGGYTVTVGTGISVAALKLTTTSGTINFSSNSIDTANISTDAASIDMFSKITGSHGLTFTSTGAGRLNIKTANDYTGDTFLTGTAFLLTDIVNNSLPTGTTLNMDKGTTFRLAKTGGSQQLAGLVSTNTGTGTATVTNTAVGYTLTLSTKAATTTTFSGTISSNSINTLNLVIDGAGTQALNGTNSFFGTVDVRGGTLSLGNGFTNAGSVAVTGGSLSSSVANVTLGTGAVTMSSGEISVRGSGGTGSFTLAANQAFSTTGGKLTFNIGTGLDQIKGSGTGTFSIGSGTELALILGAGFDYNSTYDLFSGFAGGSVAGTGVTITGYDTAGFVASLSNTGVLSFAAAPVPEPSTFAALAGAAMLGFAAVRRRRQDA